MAFLAMYIVVLITTFALQANAIDHSYNTYYTSQWGHHHIAQDYTNNEVQLQLDGSSGAGFKSKGEYTFGLFHIKMKLPPQKTGGVCTTFFLTSVREGDAPGNHYELDFEFVGTNGRLSTNVFVNDDGHREQAFNLGFDPSQDFHSYDLLWNPNQIVFFVDNIPIRVFKNNSDRGVTFASVPMHIEASIWDASGWAGPVDWSKAPFIAHYKEFGFEACPAPSGGDITKCAGPGYTFNQHNYWELNDQQKQQMKDFRDKYLDYDYCAIPTTMRAECGLPDVVRKYPSGGNLRTNAIPSSKTNIVTNPITASKANVVANNVLLVTIIFFVIFTVFSY